MKATSLKNKVLFIVLLGCIFSDAKHEIDEDSTNQCDVVSSDSRRCFIFRHEPMDFWKAKSFCEENFNATLPTPLSPEDESRIAEDFGLFFWVGVRTRLFFNESANRLYLRESWIDGSNYTDNRWDFKSFDPEIFWTNESYCAEASGHEDLSSGSVNIVWSPKDCSEEALSVLCQRPLRSFTSPVNDSEVVSHLPHLANVFSNSLTDDEEESMEMTTTAEKDDSFPRKVEDGNKTQKGGELLWLYQVIASRLNHLLRQEGQGLFIFLLLTLTCCLLVGVVVITYRHLRGKRGSVESIEGVSLVFVRRCEVSVE